MKVDLRVAGVGVGTWKEWREGKLQPGCIENKKKMKINKNKPMAQSLEYDSVC